MSANQLQENRARILHYMLLILFCILIIRFFHMQVLSGETYRKRSENNRVRQIPVLASRGIIFDSQGRVLVDNRPSYSLYLVPYEFYKNPAEAEVISSILGLSLEEIEDKINEAGNGPFTPVRIIRDMDFKTLSSVEENRLDLPGIFFQVEPVRTYPSDVRATHILGYVREVSKAELVMNQDRKIYPGDVVGKSGIERYYDNILRGQRGYQYVEVNAEGREIGDFGGVRNVTAIPGRNLIFSIDIALQKVVEDRVKGMQGAVVVLDPWNGEILAMASSPDYPLEPFSIGLSVEKWESFRQDPDKPLVNRAIQGQIPPGSTFKLVLAAAALDKRLIGRDEEVFCPGYFLLGGRNFRCWEPEGHGYIDMLNAIKVSCNVYFYRLGLKTGVVEWSIYAEQFGFGKLTQIDLAEENRGILPDKSYLDRKYGRNGWSRGTIVNLAVGQGDLLVTPIQMAKMVAIIATDGRSVQPHIVRSFQDPLSGSWEDFIPSIEQGIKLSTPVFVTLKTGMSMVVNMPKGTGRYAHVTGVNVCGKTGTAQNPQGEPHAWFVGFAPKESPRVAIVVFLESAGSGGSVAAPVAGSILQWFFSREIVS